MRIHCSVLLLALTFASGTVTGQSVLVPENIKKSVAFVYLSNETNSHFPAGTGFFVAVRLEKQPHLSQVYFVTAKHVVRKTDGSFVDRFWLRLNAKGGSSKLVEVPLRNGGVAVYQHEDPSVDLIVMRLLPNVEFFDCSFLPGEIIATKEDLKPPRVSEGAMVFFVGLFTGYSGYSRSYPVVRFGRIALLSGEKIDAAACPNGKCELILVDYPSFPGNSGSPVFMDISTRIVGGSLVLGSVDGKLLQLVGVQTVAFMNRFPLRGSAEREYAIGNTGLSGIVPAWLLGEILFSENLKRGRSQAKP